MSLPNPSTEANLSSMASLIFTEQITQFVKLLPHIKRTKSLCGRWLWALLRLAVSGHDSDVRYVNGCSSGQERVCWHKGSFVSSERSSLSHFFYFDCLFLKWEGKSPGTHKIWIDKNNLSHLKSWFNKKGYVVCSPRWTNLSPGKLNQFFDGVV